MSDVNHLRLTIARVVAIIRNPQVTYEDLDALYFSLCNDDDFGMNHPLVEVVLKKKSVVARQEVIKP